MANNIGTTNTNLSRVIGGTTTITDPLFITAITGYVDVGFLVFDSNGTMGVCTSFVRDSQNNPNYVFRTCSLNTGIDIQNILLQSY